MDAKEFLNEFKRICDFYGKEECCGCPFNKDGLIICKRLTLYDPKYILDTVEKWSKEHPKRTYLSVFLEIFPKTDLNDSGVPRFCICNLGFDYCSICIDDCKTCWNREYKEK